MNFKLLLLHFLKNSKNEIEHFWTITSNRLLKFKRLIMCGLQMMINW